MQWRAKCRAFIDEEVIPNVSEWERNKELPKDLYVKTAEARCWPR